MEATGRGTVVTVEHAGQASRLLDVGQGETILVLHGWGGRIESMGSVIACLQRRFRVLAVDLPGFGEAPLPAAAWGTPDYARWVKGLLRSLSVEGACLVGHSFGGKVALTLAADEPDLVAKLVLVDASGLRAAPSLRTRLKLALSRGGRMAGRLGGPGRALRALVYSKVASTDYQLAGPLRPTLVKVVNEDVTDLLPRIAAPTLLIWGENDPDVPVQHAHTMERLIPDSGLVVFEGTGHFSYLEQPDRFCRVIRYFLGAPVTP